MPNAGTRGMPRIERERLILDVAGQVFARGGYHSSSMDEIATLADVSKPMLYAYFGSKEGLYVAYISRTGRELVSRLVGAAAPDDPPPRSLRARILEFLSFVEEHRDGWTVLFSEMTSIQPFADEVAELRGQLADAVRAMVELAVSGTAELPAPAFDAVAQAIVGAGESLANWWLAHPEISREQLADWYADVIRGSVVALVSAHTSTKGRR
jgi:AcrR family transcriptional regulator